jgi:hypothetical protein
VVLVTDYARVLWLGGGVSYGALEIVEMVLRTELAEHEHSAELKNELSNIANAAAAELSKRPDAVCDLI